MKQKTKSAIKKGITNFFGAFGYVFGLFQWFWAIMLYFSVVKSTTMFISPDAASGHIEQTSDVTLSLPDPLKWIIFAVVVVAMVALTAYALIKMPMDIVRNSNKAVHKTAENVAPMLIKVQRKKDTKKSRLKITSRLVGLLKLLLVVVPLAFTLASGLLEKQYIAYSIATTVGYTLAAFALGAFAVQYALAFFLRVKPQDIR